MWFGTRDADCTINFFLLYPLMCGVPLMGEDTLHDPGAVLEGSEGAEGEFGGVQAGVENVAALLCLAPLGCGWAEGAGARLCPGTGDGIPGVLR